MLSRSERTLARTGISVIVRKDSLALSSFDSMPKVQNADPIFFSNPLKVSARVNPQRTSKPWTEKAGISQRKPLLKPDQIRILHHPRTLTKRLFKKHHLVRNRLEIKLPRLVYRTSIQAQLEVQVREYPSPRLLRRAK